MDPIVRAVAEAPNEDSALSEAAALVRHVTGADAVDVLLSTHGQALELRASTLAPEFVRRFRVAHGTGLAGEAAALGMPIVVSGQLRENPMYQAFPGLPESSFESAVAVPLPSADGVLVVLRRAQWEPSPAEVRQIERCAESMGTAFAVYRLAFEAGSQSNRLDAIAEAAETLTGTPYLEELLQNLVNLTARRFNYRVVSLRLLDDRRGVLVQRAAYTDNRAYVRKPVLGLGESIAGRAIRRRQPVVVQDVQQEPDFVGHDLAAEQGLRSMVCVPLQLQHRVVGVLSCYAGEVRQFPPDEVAALETLARQAAVSIEHARLQARDTLMQEMHHRVKNNLQQVASLLRLQMHHAGDRPIQEVIGESLGRIEAIAAVHDLLSREDLYHVSLTSLANTLIQHQQQSFIDPAKSVTFTVRGDDVYLNTTQATQVALILNELILNAVTHGFHEANSGEVHVTVEDDDGEIGLWVSNDGDPLPPEFDPTQGNLGLKIAEGLARSLGGTFKLEDRLGWTVAELRFSRAAAE
jgi:two-component system, sensor histidine kinase PdtaS